MEDRYGIDKISVIGYLEKQKHLLKPGTDRGFSQFLWEGVTGLPRNRQKHKGKNRGK